MSSVGLSDRGRIAAAAITRRSFHCYECNRTVEVTTAELVCPVCYGGFLEEMESYHHLPPPPPQPHPRPSASSSRTTGIPPPLIPPRMSIDANTSNRRGHPLPHPPPSLLPPLQRYALHPQPSPLPPPPPPPVTPSNSREIRPSSPPLPSSLISNWVGDTFPDYIDPDPDLDLVIDPWLAKEVRRQRDSAKEKLMKLDRKMTRELMSSTSSPCAVCLENLKLDQTVKKMPCKHIFHSDCISTWLDSHHTCPVCRYKLPWNFRGY